MLIVLEGCDGTGKSTLARLLSEIYDAKIIHCSTHTSNDFEFFTRIIEAAKTTNIIADRWCYGQFVYQDVLDRPLGKHKSDTYKALEELELIMLESGVKMILVDAPTEVIKQRLAARDETILNNLDVDTVRIAFRGLKNTSLLTWSEYNTGGETN